ncbi:MAG: Rne/Rng family ribonuclease [Myxococcales bacterium]|nr:Rne/Rng family ribonuclease [Myxococcales bacterium]
MAGADTKAQAGAHLVCIQASREETRVAVLQGGDLVELQVERTTGRGLSGNVYRGRVARLVPSMDAAFVDIGLDRMALLHAPDVWLPGLEAQPSADEEDDAPVRRRAQRVVAELLAVGQQVMVQVVREPVARKGPRVTMFVSLPGRNLVLLPRDPHIGVSKKIDDPVERDRLRSVVQRHLPPGTGVIVRTVGEGATEQELADDVGLLADQWADIQTRYECASGPSFIFDDLDLVLRAVRDLVGPDTEAVCVDDPAECERVERFLKRFHKGAPIDVRLHDGPRSLFETFGLDAQVRGALAPRVRLPSGGELVIDRTEAMTVIDVNSAHQSDGASLADAVLRLNIEAAVAVARQLRLRNIGGLVVVDFVRMVRADGRKALETAFAEALAHDRARVRVGRLSEFDTISLSRKRVRESIYERLTEPCPTCKGQGYVRSAADVALEALRRIQRAADGAGGQAPAAVVKVGAPTRVAAILRDQLAGSVRDIEARAGVRVEIEDSGRGIAGGVDVRVTTDGGRWRIGGGTNEGDEPPPE